MATSGNKSVTVTSWDTLKFSWWQSGDQNIANNTTTVGWKLELIATGSGRIDSSASKTWSVTVNGTKYSGTNTVGIGNNSTKTLASGYTSITHEADGSKTFSYSFSQQFDIDFNGRVGTISGSGSGALNTIPRASQPSCITWPNHTQNVGNFGNTIAIHTNRASSAFTHVIRYAFGSTSGTCINAETGKLTSAEKIGTGFQWKIPETLMNLIPNGTSGSGTIYCDTYNGTTLIGTKSCGFTATVPASVKPTCTLTLDDTTGLDDIYGSPVQGLSKIKVTINPTLAYSSPIDSYSISIDGNKYNAATVTTGALKASGSVPVTVTVKDKRGRSGSASYTMSVWEYSSANISRLAVHRCDADGTENEQGEYIKVSFDAKVTVLSNYNTASYTLAYKKSSAANYTTVALSSLKDKYTVQGYSHVFPADGNSPYDVSITVKDSHSTTTRTTSASTAFTLYNCHRSGTGWRFGGVADKEYTVQNDLSLCQVGNSYAFQPGAFSGAKGYTLLARITLTSEAVNAPIVFTINKRGAVCPMHVYVRFINSGDTIDPALDTITYEGDNYGAFLVKDSTSTWKLYVDNTYGWSNPCLQSWYTTESQQARLTVTFPSEQVEELPTPYYRATPVKMRSLVDFIYPVGSIYLSYSHVDPATLFGGTWTRISNAFLWAVAADGTIGQTGGEKTHTLTTAEMPKHSHGIRWTSSNGNAGGTSQANPMVRYGDTGTGYSGATTVETGGGEAHNNMPPYIQVSAWRRTA